MRVVERAFSSRVDWSSGDILRELQQGFARHSQSGEGAVRYVITGSSARTVSCETGVVTDFAPRLNAKPSDLFAFRKRKLDSVEKFNAVFIVPTGIGAEIGGHAGDAGSVARLLAGACDTLVLHPNVVNASDINELPENALYVEGSILTRLMMGTIGLRRSRSNRLLVVVEDHVDPHFVNLAVNSVNAARATYGLDCGEVVCLNPPVRMFAEYAPSGSAVGRVEGLEYLISALSVRSDFDAVAVSSVIRVPHEYHTEYFESEGGMVNPWGGVEAMLTHAISAFLDIPAAHSPMFESKKIENLEVGIVDPRMAAEAVSASFLQCILKGLQQSPKIVKDQALFNRSDVFSVEDVSCLIIPDGCLGLPTVAALQQGIPVIAVRDNKNVMRNDLTRLPWRRGQFIQVENYLEACGVIGALKSGVTLESVRRPISATRVIREAAEVSATEESA